MSFTVDDNVSVLLRMVLREFHWGWYFVSFNAHYSSLVLVLARPTYSHYSLYHSDCTTVAVVTVKVFLLRYIYAGGISEICLARKPCACYIVAGTWMRRESRWWRDRDDGWDSSGLVTEFWPVWPWNLHACDCSKIMSYSLLVLALRARNACQIIS